MIFCSGFRKLSKNILNIVCPSIKKITGVIGCWTRPRGVTAKLVRTYIERSNPRTLDLGRLRSRTVTEVEVLGPVTGVNSFHRQSCKVVLLLESVLCIYQWPKRQVFYDSVIFCSMFGLNHPTIGLYVFMVPLDVEVGVLLVSFFICTNPLTHIPRVFNVSTEFYSVDFNRKRTYRTLPSRFFSLPDVTCIIQMFCLTDFYKHDS